MLKKLGLQENNKNGDAEMDCEDGTVNNIKKPVKQKISKLSISKSRNVYNDVEVTEPSSTVTSTKPKSSVKSVKPTSVPVNSTTSPIKYSSMKTKSKNSSSPVNTGKDNSSSSTLNLSQNKSKVNGMFV